MDDLRHLTTSEPSSTYERVRILEKFTRINPPQLVGGFNPSEKYDVNWDDYSQHMER